MKFEISLTPHPTRHSRLDPESTPNTQYEICNRLFLPDQHIRLPELAHDLNYTLWQDDASKGERDLMQKELTAIIGIEIPQEDIEQVKDTDNPGIITAKNQADYEMVKSADWKDEDKTDDWKNSVIVNNTNRDFVVNCRRAGIVSSDRLSVHCLRKSYGTNLADLGTPVHTLKALMGHSNIQTTMKFYIKNNDENSRKAVRGLEGLMG